MTCLVRACRLEVLRVWHTSFAAGSWLPSSPCQLSAEDVRLLLLAPYGPAMASNKCAEAAGSWIVRPSLGLPASRVVNFKGSCSVARPNQMFSSSPPDVGRQRVSSRLSLRALPAELLAYAVGHQSEASDRSLT